MTTPEFNLTLETLLNRGEQQTAEDFSIFIEKTANESGENYLDVILDFCETQGIDADSIVKSITPALRQKIEAQCERLNLLKTKSTPLPE